MLNTLENKISGVAKLRIQLGLLLLSSILSTHLHMPKTASPGCCYQPPLCYQSLIKKLYRIINPFPHVHNANDQNMSPKNMPPLNDLLKTRSIPKGSTTNRFTFPALQAAPELGVLVGPGLLVGPTVPVGPGVLVGPTVAVGPCVPVGPTTPVGPARASRRICWTAGFPSAAG